MGAHVKPIVYGNKGWHRNFKSICTVQSKYLYYTNHVECLNVLKYLINIGVKNEL